MEKGDFYASIDKEMKEISGKKFREEILAYPPFIQEELWSDAFGKIKEENFSKIKYGKYLFLTFHACYYHQKKTSFLSPVNFKKLQDFADRIKMIIVLIDDCYDIYKRLLGKGDKIGYGLDFSETIFLFKLSQELTEALSSALILLILP